MADFNRNRDSRNSRSGGGRDYGTRGFDKPQMFKATCSECGNECEVPFRPNGRKPVLCSSCFEKSGGRDAQQNDRPAFRNDSRRSNFEDRPMYDAVCANCKKLFQIPFQPRLGKPVFCNNCFARQDNPRNNDNQAPRRTEENNNDFQYKKQFDSINYKLDKLLRLLTPASVPEEASKLEQVVAVAEEAVKELEEKKVAKKKTVAKKKAPAKKK